MEFSILMVKKSCTPYPVCLRQLESIMTCNMLADFFFVIKTFEFENNGSLKVLWRNLNNESDIANSRASIANDPNRNVI